MDVTCGRKGGVLPESPEAPAGWSAGCKVFLGCNMCKGKRRRARLSRGRSLDQSAGSSGEKVVPECTLSGKKARPIASFNDRKASNTEGSDSWGPVCCPHSPQLGRSFLAGAWAVHLCVCHRSLRGSVLTWQLDGWIFISYDGDFWYLKPVLRRSPETQTLFSKWCQGSLAAHVRHVASQWGGQHWAALSDKSLVPTSAVVLSTHVTLGSYFIVWLSFLSNKMGINQSIVKTSENNTCKHA